MDICILIALTIIISSMPSDVRSCQLAMSLPPWPVCRFDTIDHSILITRLSSWFGIHGSVLNCFKSYLTSVRPVLNVIKTSFLSIFLLVVFIRDVNKATKCKAKAKAKASRICPRPGQGQGQSLQGQGQNRQPKGILVFTKVGFLLSIKCQPNTIISING